ncbi:NAD(P)-dependent oxidoreductase [Sphingomonas sp. G-3-2-10]|uniref:NAD(P)-dependent oxidoreductase n=1 Tax=Sphingomonas sp. G-3-2-10 TaxID=2728838 RepID=UPI00146B3DAE|nr:NAD(P)-dependent oxidoreductase [Sphingomonas sp. G-3-2-10]NML04866.1 NAD(P)-dependent oxidoreductase [Sphingomonas sp. G-3-2-10]
MNGIAFIGFGEAAQAFAGHVPARVYDVKAERRAEAAGRGVESRDSAADALKGARAILSLVTADQALAVAKDYAASLEPGALWFDMNSVAPDTKREAALAIEAAGGRYVDVAVMSPVYPAQLGVPLLVSGPHAEAGAETLRAIGFSKVRVVPGDVGRASSIKMIRSVMVKGLEALTTECVLAADAAGVLDEVIASLNASWPGTDWAEKTDYNLDRMMIHGLRRSAEMYESSQTLLGLGISPMMTEGTVNWQQGIGELGLAAPDGLSAKLEAIKARRKELGA